MTQCLPASAPNPLARTVPGMTKRTLLAVDGNSLLHRSFHALESTNLRTRDGRPTWAVKGFMNLMLAALERTGADAVVVGFDDHTSSIRKAQHPLYKAQRPPKPPELGQQIALTIDTLRGAGVHVVVPRGLEADDVMASAAAAAAAAGWNTVIVTSDRDSFALIDETTQVLRLLFKGGIDAATRLTPERLVTLTGVRADQYREYAAMRGDTSDNLDGIKGIGEKYAAKLLAAFGTVQAAFDDVDTNAGARVAAEVGKAMVAKLTDPVSRLAFERNLDLMTMRRDVPLGIDLRSPGHGLLPLDQACVTAAMDSLELAAVRAGAVRVLCGTRQSAPQVAPTHGEDIPPAEPPLDDEPPFPDTPDGQHHRGPQARPDEPGAVPAPRQPVASPQPAMQGSAAPKPARWDDSLW